MIRTTLLLLLMIAMGVSFQSCKGKKGNERIETITKVAEPQFKMEGTLSFLSGNDTIKTIDIEIADDAAERNKGMMHRSSMDYGKGMLFIFEYEDEQSFWMKNTKMSLDIMYVGANYEIVTIHKYTQPYSPAPIPSMKPAQYVVETAAGFVDKFGINEGDKIAFSRVTDPV